MNDDLSEKYEVPSTWAIEQAQKLIASFLKFPTEFTRKVALALDAANMPCQCCRDHGCSDGCRCKQVGDF